MKYIPVLFTCLILFSCKGNKNHTGIKNVHNDLAKAHLFGRVKSVCKVTYAANVISGNIVKGEQFGIDSEKYNPAGFMTEQATYQQGVLLTREIISKYDAHNNVLEEHSYFNYNLGQTDSIVDKDYTFECTTNPEGKILKKITMLNGKLVETQENTLDNDGNIIEDKKYSPGDTLVEDAKFKYNIRGNIIEIIRANADGKVTSKIKSTYDTAGNMLEDLRYKSDTTWDTKDLMTYDGTGNELEHTCQYYWGNGNYIFDWKYTYPSFDREGNWVKNSFYEKGQLISVKERTIEYYK